MVLGDATCLSNDGIPFSYTFCGPLLAALAQKDATPLAWWRQLAAIAAAAAAVVLLFHRFEPLRLVIAAIAVAVWPRSAATSSMTPRRCCCRRLPNSGR